MLTRKAEADMQRAGKGTSYLLDARIYVQHRLNRMPAAPHAESRWQRYYGKVPTVDAARPFYLFGTTVLFNEEKAARGPKGSLTKPRAVEGTLVGLTSDGAAYLVKLKNGGVAEPRFVDPLDELQLMRRGIPSGAAELIKVQY